MELLSTLLDFLLHVDRHLAELISRYGPGAYLVLFLIIFGETGLVVTPFLPGDSLLFAVGALAGLGLLDPALLVVGLTAAAVAGNTANYWIGRYVGPRAFGGGIRWLRLDYLRRTEEFYRRHGGKTIVLTRFVPILRTFAPFVAGIGRMPYGRFSAYNLAGGVAWVSLFVLGGYFFGALPVVRANFSLVVLAIILVSVAPLAVEAARRSRAGAGQGGEPEG